MTDLRSGAVLAENLLVPVCYEDKGDTWCFNIDSYEKEPMDFGFEKISVIESGETLTEIKVAYTKENARMDVYYRFYRDASYFDVRYRVNWEDRHRVLKLECDVQNMDHLAAVPAGQIARGEKSADVPLGAWVKADQMTVAADGIFAYSMAGGKLGLTVLRSPIYGDLRLSELDDSIDYDIIDRDVVEGKLRVSFGGDAWETADALCNPPIVIDESNHEGDLPAENSFYGIDCESVALLALKQCEDDGADIVRLCETVGDEKTVILCARGRKITVYMAPYEIKTLKLTDTAAVEVDMIEFNEVVIQEQRKNL